MIVYGYTKDGSIRIEIDGTEMFVPDDMGNRHRQMVAEWEADGNTIPAYVPPSAPSPRLTAMWRARAIAKVTPHGNGTLFDAVVAAIANMTDPLVQAAASEAWERGTTFDLDGQLVPVLVAALGMTEEDVLPLIAAAENLPA